MTCKALVDELPDGDVSRVGFYGARFAGVVFPGTTLRSSIGKATGCWRWLRRPVGIKRSGCRVWSWRRRSGSVTPTLVRLLRDTQVRATQAVPLLRTQGGQKPTATSRDTVASS
jgi:hypothetical protein